MKLLKVTQQDKNFYNLLGPIFGSRLIQKATQDRFFDDANKVWHLAVDEDKVIAGLSLVDNTIKNSFGNKALGMILGKIKTNGLKGIVPVVQKSIYEQEGFTIIDTYVNFMEVRYND